MVDRLERAYVGNFGFDHHRGELPKPTELAKILPESQVEAVVGNLLFPNGSVITDDGKTLIVAEA